MTPADLLVAATARKEFASAVARPEAEIDLARAALLIAAEDEPNRVNLRASLELLDAWGAEARSRVERSAGEEIATLNDLLFHELGFYGNQDDYYDPLNSLLHRVLERRTGIPITLSVVYMEVGRRAGLAVEGVGMPGHFIVRARAGDGEGVLVDPFHGKTIDREECQQRLDMLYGGRVALEDEHLRATGTRSILARVLGNLKAIYVEAGLHRRALAAIERILLLAPHNLEERRDRGIVLAELGRLHESVAEMQSYLNLAPNAPDAEAVRERLERTRLRVAALN